MWCAKTWYPHWPRSEGTVRVDCRCEHEQNSTATHLQQTGCRRPHVQSYVRWGRRCSSPWELWAPPAGGGRTPHPSPPCRSSTPGSGCRGRRRSARTAPASPWPASPRPSPGRSSGGRCQRTRACPSASPAASRAWRSRRRRQQHTAGTAAPR